MPMDPWWGADIRSGGIRYWHRVDEWLGRYLCRALCGEVFNALMQGPPVQNDSVCPRCEFVLQLKVSTGRRPGPG